MNSLHQRYFKVDSRPAHTEYAQRLAVSKGISKGARAFAMVLYSHYNHKRHDAYPRDQRIMNKMAEILGKDVSISYFQKARCAAFKACLFVYLPKGGQNNQNIYCFLQFWRPDEKGAFKPIDHTYPGFQKGAGRRKLDRIKATPKCKPAAVAQVVAACPTQPQATVNCRATPLPMAAAQAADERLRKAMNSLRRKFAEYDPEELAIYGMADDFAINISLEFGLESEQINEMMNGFEQCTTLHIAALSPAH